MKTTRLHSQTKKGFLVITALMIGFSFGSYAQKISFLTSSVVPAAQGYVKVKRDNNMNYVIKIHISDLAEVERIQPLKQTYVVWMVTDRDIKKNIGRVNSSNKLKVSFETVSSFKPIKIFITAEVDESVQIPGDQIVLTTDKFWDQ